MELHWRYSKGNEVASQSGLLFSPLPAGEPSPNEIAVEVSEVARGPALVQTLQWEGQRLEPFSSNGDAHAGTGWEGAGSLLTPCLSLLWSRLEPCDSQPCQNGGTCVPEGLDKYHCLCPVGYGGDIHCGRCEPTLSLLPSRLCPAFVSSSLCPAQGRLGLGCSLRAFLQETGWVYSRAGYDCVRPSQWLGLVAQEPCEYGEYQYWQSHPAMAALVSKCRCHVSRRAEKLGETHRYVCWSPPCTHGPRRDSCFWGLNVRNQRRSWSSENALYLLPAEPRLPL